MTKHKQHWYKRFIYECPVCGHISEYRERVYGEKPPDPEKRIVWSWDTDCARRDVALG